MRDAAATVRRIVRHASGSYVPFLAGSLAFHAFLLLVPLLLLLLVVVSAVGGASGVAYLVSFTEPYLTPRARTVIADAVLGVAHRTEVVLLGVGALVWISFRIFRGLDVIFATIYDTSTHESVRAQLTDGAIAVLAIALSLLAGIVAGTVIAVLPWDPLVRVLNALLLGVVLAIIFFPLYYVFPNVDVSAREVLPGTVAAAVGWLIFHLLFQVYTAYAFTLNAYGVLGAALLVLLWLYSSMVILLLGAVVNAVLAGRA